MIDYQSVFCCLRNRGMHQKHWNNWSCESRHQILYVSNHICLNFLNSLYDQHNSCAQTTICRLRCVWVCEYGYVCTEIMTTKRKMKMFSKNQKETTQTEKRCKEDMQKCSGNSVCRGGRETWSGGRSGWQCTQRSINITLCQHTHKVEYSVFP